MAFIAKDLPGLKFGMLTVQQRIRPSAGKKWNEAHWMVVCDCGARRTMKTSALTTRATTSCGCARNHGLTGHELYQMWQGMNDRCSNPQMKSYKNYGGRGITVCQRWRDFRMFVADMPARPSAKHTIDRIDNDRGYEPGNCRWATREEQAFNNRRTRWIDVRGEMMPMKLAAAKLGLSYAALRARLDRGWSVSRAVTPSAKRSITAGHAHSSHVASTST